MNHITLATSTCDNYTFSTDVKRIVSLWCEQYRLARREYNPISAVLDATLSTAETWKVIR